MEIGIFKQMIAVIRSEEQRRARRLRDEDPNFAYDQWLFKHEPFVNELCLMLLVALRHQVERELVWLAALARHQGKEISGQEYRQNVQQLRKCVRKGKSWKEINDRLKLESCEGYRSVDLLRLLANSYKHDPRMEPDEDLLKLLQLDTKVPYAPLPESASLREGLAAFVGLEKDTAYSDIAERFVDILSNFLVNVQSRTTLSRVKWGPVWMHPDSFLH